ncbi:unnamed protein product [Thlaspi arvense]|uniref:Rho GTPase-activating protein REN1-like n=1 Tax=Thlaspi arvense TaxID=13288 RepID=A0AAU9T1M8_THLAR|nr:unnamed protein product [Thlaspi arvense]
MANKNGETSSQSPQVQPPPQQQQPQHQQQQQQNANEQELEQHGDTCSIPPAQTGNADARSRGGNTVFKSGPLSISSKGLGWTSWKKRWFILTRTSLVFFRSDPSAVQQRGSEVNLTLGGIDLNNSGSVVVKADKKLLTVLFPDGRDGRAFTLKADTMEDLYEWKTALESALTQAPSASHVMGQNGIFRNDHAEAPVGVDEQQKDETPPKSSVIGRPVLLALEDVDGAPSFLEKALRFVEDHGVRIEGILRQAADVDDVEHRIREYEQGRNEFTPTEDAHVIADCLKYFLRELPSSPVPASCCNALLEACRTDRGNRVNAMREAICESFPEPNRRLLQRILMMMQIVASNKNVNRMNTNAVAACMAPLLLRPLLAGDCEIENDFDVGGDGSMQLLQAAAAANHAQAIVITLLEEYESIFGINDNLSSESKTPKGSTEPQVIKKLLSGSKRSSLPRHNDAKKDENIRVKGFDNTEVKPVVEVLTSEDKSSSTSDVASPSLKPETLTSPPGGSKRHWGRTSGKRNLSMESIDFAAEVVEDDADIERLESTKLELQDRISEEVKNNAVLQTSLERRKKALYVRRQALEKDVERLQEQLQQERDRKLALEAGLNMSKGNQPIPEITDEKLKKDLQDVAQAEVDIANLEHKVDDLENRLGHQDVKASGSTHGSSKESRKTPEHNAKMKEKQKDTETGSSLKIRNVLQDGQGGARENEIEKQQDQRSKSSQQEMPRGSSKLAGMSKRSGSKGEGTTTTSALSKLTMRLNFLKERRSQIANELLNMDKGRSSGQASPSSGQNQSLQETEKGTGSNQDSDSSKHQSPHVLDRGRSENGGDRGDRGRGSGGNNPNTTSRTFSR